MKHLFILTSSKHNWFSTFNNKSIFKLQKVISAIKLRCLRKNKMRSKWTILYCMPFSHINLFWHKKRIEFTNILCERVFIDISSFYVHANPLMSRKDYDLDWLLQIISFQSMSHLNWSWHNHLCLKFALICRFCYLTLPVAKYWFLLNQFWSFWKQKKNSRAQIQCISIINIPFTLRTRKFVANDNGFFLRKKICFMYKKKSHQLVFIW